MMGFPTHGWGSSSEAQILLERPLEAAPFAADWVALNQNVRHLFTHFELTLTIYHARLDGELPEQGGLPEGYWLVSPQEEGLASVFGKVWQVVADLQEGRDA
jgi:A/G-specific adenine glycosylase